MVKRNAKGQYTKGYRHSPATEFKPGHETWNKGKHHAPPGSERGHFKKGELPKSAHPEGTVTRYERTRNGRKEVYYSINIDWRGNRKPHNSYRWYIWEVAHQEDRPKGMLLTVKNGNPDDIRLENLEVIDRRENLRRSTGK